MATRSRLTKIVGIQYKGVSYTDGGGVSISIIDKDSDGYILRATGTTVPTAGTAGYSKGCFFIDTDTAASYQGCWINIGSATACDFALLSIA